MRADARLSPSTILSGPGAGDLTIDGLRTEDDEGGEPAWQCSRKELNIREKS
jgi:hypothetical protein